MEKIIEKLKSKLNITWKEEETEKRLKEIVELAIPKINRLIGTQIIDFLNELYKEELDLLLNYCMYEWENKTELFKRNYYDDILSLQQKHEVEQYKKEQENEQNL